MNQSAPMEMEIESRSLSSEGANQLTHGFGFLLSIVGAVVLLQATSSSEDVWQVAGCNFYGLSLVALYAASTLSHSFEKKHLREFFRMLDQVCIFLLILGTFTPFAVVHLREGYWWTLLAAMWILAFVGIGFRMFRRDQAISTMSYVILGWLPIIAIERMAEVGSLKGLALMLAGGASYSIGTYFLASDHKHPYFHAVWHVMVIVGSICHFLYMLFWVAMWPGG